MRQRRLGVAQRDLSVGGLEPCDRIARLKHIAAPHAFGLDTGDVDRRDGDVFSLDIADDDIVGRRAEWRKGRQPRELAKRCECHDAPFLAASSAACKWARMTDSIAAASGGPISLQPIRMSTGARAMRK